MGKGGGRDSSKWLRSHSELMCNFFNQLIKKLINYLCYLQTWSKQTQNRKWGILCCPWFSAPKFVLYIPMTLDSSKEAAEVILGEANQEQACGKLYFLLLPSSDFQQWHKKQRLSSFVKPSRPVFFFQHLSPAISHLQWLYHFYLNIPLEVTGNEVITSFFPTGRPDRIWQTLVRGSEWEGFFECAKSTHWSSACHASYDLLYCIVGLAAMWWGSGSPPHTTRHHLIYYQ